MNPKSDTQDSIENHYVALNSFGYIVIKNIYQKDDIQRIAEAFDKKFVADLKRKKVQSRDYRRFACKLPISNEYEPILNNPYVHNLMSRALGENYVLYAFNSHSSLPGSSHQLMHYDALDPFNSRTFTSKETSFVFLHIPLIDMSEEHGITECWPITFYTRGKKRRRISTLKWIKDNVSKSDAIVEQGDLIIKLANCIHAGGANKSKVRRHMITLIFARRHFYLTYNTGLIPCAVYDGQEAPRLPYRISANTSMKSVNMCNKYTRLGTEKALIVPFGLAQQMEFYQQYKYMMSGLSDRLLAEIKMAPLNFIQDANRVFNLVEHVLPIVTAAFRGMPFQFHSAILNESTRDLRADDPTFQQYLEDGVFNNSENLIRIHLPLQTSKEWMETYPGNKTLSLNVLRDKSSCIEHRRSLSSEKGVVLITTGALIYSRVEKVPTIELTFISSHHVPSYDDRYRVTDTFALSLPKKLGRLLRYDNVFITQSKYKDFRYSWLESAGYRIFNYHQNLALDNRLAARFFTLLVVFGLLPALPFVFIYFKMKHPVSLMLEGA